MADFSLSPNMNLPIPTVGVAGGPDWATLLDSCMSIIDVHSHVPGAGVPITPAALSINADLPMGANNLIDTRSVRFHPQSATLSLSSDIGCAYVSGVDLYYNDVNGTPIRITQSGNVAGTPGSIANLVPPASASYVAANSTFVWQSDSNIAANMDAGSLILRNLTPSSPGLTLQPPPAMGSDTTLTLPTLPLVTNIMSLSASGIMSAAINVDNSTIQLASNVLSVNALGIGTGQIADSAVTTPKIADAAVTLAKLVNLNVVASSFFAITTGTAGTVSITTHGRPVFAFIVSGGCSCALNQNMSWAIRRDGSAIGAGASGSGGISGATGSSTFMPVSTVGFDPGVSAGGHTYDVTVTGSSNPGNTIAGTLVVVEF